MPTPRYGLAARILEQLTGQICEREIVKFDSFYADIYYGRVDHEWAVDIEVTSINCNAIALSCIEKLII